MAGKLGHMHAGRHSPTMIPARPSQALAESRCSAQVRERGLLTYRVNLLLGDHPRRLQAACFL